MAKRYQDFKYENKLALAEFLRLERERMGFTQIEMAQDLKMKPNRLIALENSTYDDPNFLALAKIVDSKKFLLARDPDGLKRTPITLDEISMILHGKLNPHTGELIENGNS